MKSLLWLIVILLVMAVAVLGIMRWEGCTGEQAPGEALSRRMLENATYASPGTEMKTVRLSGGKFANAEAHVWITMLDVFATGDLDGDRRPEAVVVLATNTGGTGVFHSLHVVRDERGRPVDVAVAELGDRIELKALKIEDGRVVLEMLTHGPSDPMCCPTVRVEQIYELRENELVLVEQTPPDIDEPD